MDQVAEGSVAETPSDRGRAPTQGRGLSARADIDGAIAPLFCLRCLAWRFLHLSLYLGAGCAARHSLCARDERALDRQRSGFGHRVWLANAAHVLDYPTADQSAPIARLSIGRAHWLH